MVRPSAGCLYYHGCIDDPDNGRSSHKITFLPGIAEQRTCPSVPDVAEQGREGKGLYCRNAQRNASLRIGLCGVNRLPGPWKFRECNVVHAGVRTRNCSMALRSCGFIRLPACEIPPARRSGSALYGHRFWHTLYPARFGT